MDLYPVDFSLKYKDIHYDTLRLIDDRIGIVFTQNMKSMEKYYRWVSQRYVETFGRLHHNLVDTILRYNNRALEGKYIATLAGTRKWSNAREVVAG